ncbi:MAG: C45 family peptidase [Lentisphaeraceae bacterium]|nr:C45 family peptidase [Lentisphaeraceae bacterium]
MNNKANYPIEKLPVYEFHGSIQEIGHQYGESCRQQIQELCKIRIDAALDHAKERGRSFSKKQALELIALNTPIIKDFDSEIFEETAAIAEAANVSFEELILMQGLTDYRDYLSWGKIPEGFGCTSIISPREQSKNGKLLLAQNWDLGTTNMPYVCFIIRHPNDKPSSYNLTVAGGLSLIGLNSHGVAIGTNNIKSTDSRLGVHYLNLIHKAMDLGTCHEVVSMIQSTQRSGAHYFLIGDKDGNSAGVECTATKTAIRKAKDGIVTHCNHILDEELAKLEAENMGDSTCARQKRVDELIQDKKLCFDSIKEILSDHENGELSICRHSDMNGISTNASIIIEPEDGKIHACRSHPHIGEWQTFSAF